MADPLDGFAQLLDAAGHVDYRPGEVCDVALDDMPADVAVGLWLYDGDASDTVSAYDTPRLQVRVRDADRRAAYARAQAIYSELHGLAGIELPDGTWLVLAAARSTVAPMGRDTNGRYEYVANFDVDISAPTTHRTE